MACSIDEPQPNFKHYCRVCKKGFMCGRALGGHMRAHGIGDESANLDDDDDDPISDWEERFGGGNNNNNNNNNKKMYQLRTNPNRLKSCRTCENCGKEFVSWKSFLEHGKCSSDDASESLVSSPDSDSDNDSGGARRWSKRKRSVRSKVVNVGCSYNNSSSYPPGEEDDILLARCLVQLANTVVDLPPAEPEESCASASREEERRKPINSYFAPTNKGRAFDNMKAKGVVSSSSPKGTFECKACKKVFNSHQALGGHRASHKKVKGCYAAKQDHQDENNGSGPAIEEEELSMIPPPPPLSKQSFQFEQGGGGHALVGAARRKSKVHECSICHRVFNSGQALGGHKRCHWITSNSPETSSLPKFNFHDNNNNNNNNKPTGDNNKRLDLNVPAWAHVMRPGALTLDMQLQPWVPAAQVKKADGNIHEGVVDRKIEDEADSKLIKLSDLKEMDNSGASSQWLQVGIGSTTTKAAADA